MMAITSSRQGVTAFVCGAVCLRVRSSLLRRLRTVLCVLLCVRPSLRLCRCSYAEPFVYTPVQECVCPLRWRRLPAVSCASLAVCNSEASSRAQIQALLPRRPRRWGGLAAVVGASGSLSPG